MKQHNRGRSRKMDWKHAKRKRSIVRSIIGGDWYDNLHQYSKNKIHCSCSMCNPRKSWGGSPNSVTSNKISDQRKLQAMREEVEEDMNEVFDNNAE